MKRLTFAGVALWIAAASAAEAAAPLPVYFDPVFDPVCRVVTPAPTGEVWDAAWVWHPGQLQAHRQAAILRDSKARCVNVDYPSRYNPRATKTYFRTVRELGDYRVTGGAKLSRADGRTVLAVETAGRMPALIARGTSPADWETSLDGERWVPAESDPQLTRPGALPETWEPEIVELPSRARTVLSPGEWVEDFRYVQLGTVTFRASGKGVLSFVPGESVEEARCDNWSIHEQPPVPDVMVDGTDVRVTLPERAMRYLRMRVRAGNVSVRDVMLTAKMEKVRFAFAFTSDDQTLNRLFDAGLATVHASMGYGFHIDGVKRDALPWSMDAMLSVLAASWCLDNRQVIRNDISIGVMPPDPKVADMACVDYPLHAILGIETDYLRHRDLSVFKAMRTRLEGQLALYEKSQDANGFVPATRVAFFGYLPSWARYNGPENYGTPAYAQMLLCLNYDLYARFYERLGDRAAAVQCRAKGATLKDKIVRSFWDPSRHAFVNGFREDGTLDRRICHHTQYWAILAGLFPDEHLDALFRNVLPRLPRYYTDISYEKGYELLAYQKAGRAADFYANFLLGAWKDWLDQGHTSFPEQFNVGLEKREQLCFYGRPFGRSLCHGTNGMVPVLFALRSALGCQEGERPGEHAFTPLFVGGATRYEATLLVKEGKISVTFVRGSPAKVVAPKGVRVTVNGTNVNGAPWLDDRDERINAHGGGLLHHGGRYWWFGEHKGFDEEGHKAKVGVHCYSSANLADWKDEGVALRVSDDPANDIASGNTIERPKVIYCPKTGKFSMFFHLELAGKGYSAARVGIAVADRVAGPYRFIRSLRPLAGRWPHDVPAHLRTPETLSKMTGELDIRTYRGSSYSPMPMFGDFFADGQMVRDMTLFVDDDGTAYHVYASEGNATLQIAELTDDFLDYTGRFARVFPKGFNEAPALCKRGGVYYMIASDCTGWEPNACRAYRAENIFGPWHEIGNPCRGTNPLNGLGPEKTFGGQPTFIQRVAGTDRHIALFDVWRKECLGDSRYYWLPITFTDDGRIEIHWQADAAK